jgi:hypothetical protein
MAVAETHPSAEELAAFTLGTLAEDALAAVAAHVAACTACQERADAAPADALLELLRRAHARTGRAADTVTEAVAQAQTPAPLPDDAVAVRPAPTVTMAAPAGSDVPPIIEAVPAELADHERYRVVRLLGAGGMGAVYEAEHRVLKRPVALKVINRAYTARPAAVERFRREVRAAARLSHPNIVTTHDAEDAGDTHFLVMEYVAGVSLGRLVKERGPLPVAAACACVRQAALGLQHAHERGMVHRDVKPDNLIRCADGTVKVLDFGLAVLTAERGGGLTDTDVVMGTADYMAPEQAADARTADIRADVYSLGCTLYYLLTGKAPYPAPTSVLKILAHREQPLPSIRRACPAVPPELAAVMARLLAKRPEDRYATPCEVAAALAPFTAGGAAPPRPWRWPRIAVLAAVLLVAVTLAGAVYRIQTDKGELVITTERDDVKVIITQGGKEVDVIDMKTDKRITLNLRSGTYELELQGAPRGLKLNIEGKVTLTRGETVLAKIEWVPRTEQPSPKKAMIQVLQRVSVPFNPRCYFAAVAPDGKLFAADLDYGRGVTTVVWDGKTGQEIRRHPAGLPCFTTDGKRFLVVEGKDELCIYEADTGVKQGSVAFSSWIWGHRALPGGRHHLVHTAKLQLHLIDLKDRKILQSWPLGNQDPAYAFTEDGGTLLVRPFGEKSYRVVNLGGNRQDRDFAGILRAERINQYYPFTLRQAVVFDAGRYRLVDVATGRHLADLLPLPHGLPQRRSWGFSQFDWRAQLGGLADGTLRLFDSLTGKEHAVFRLPVGEMPGPQEMSPDGRHACVVTDRSVYLLRLPALPPVQNQP